MLHQTLADIFTTFKKLKVLVIGDVMLDAYIYGAVERISPEAPVPIVNVKSHDQRLGGAANVALNIQSLGAIPILCSVIGEDVSGNEFLVPIERLLRKTESFREVIIYSELMRKRTIL
jgi:bifunctional ADP-heptose synthase (sugar kinase/adenylyltransferase)